MNIKKLITDSINEIYPNLKEEEKDKIGLTALYYILDKPYYKNTYFPTALTFNGTDSFILFNKHEVGNRNNETTIHTLKNDEHILAFFGEINEIDEEYSSRGLTIDKSKSTYVVKDSILPLFQELYDLILNSDNKIDYMNNLLNANTKNEHFLSVFHSFDYLFSDFNLFFNQWIYSSLEKTIEIESSLCKFNQYLSNRDPEDYDKEIDQIIWDESKEYMLEEIQNIQNNITSISQYVKQEWNIIEPIVNIIIKNKPYLNKKPNEQTFDLFYYETAIVKDNSHYDPVLILDSELSVSPESLEKNNIQLEPVYHMIFSKPEDNYSLTNKYKKHVRDNIVKLDNELNPLYLDDAYGLIFFESFFSSRQKQNSYITAKVDGEIAGILSFSSTSDCKDSIIKCIDYLVIKDNFRGSGLSEILYDKAMNIALDNQFILTNSSYTLDGSKYLSIKKSDIAKQYPELLILEQDFGNFNKEDYKQYNNIKEFNEYLVAKIRKKEIEGYTSLLKKHIPLIKQFRDSFIEESKNLLHKSDFFSLYDLRETKLFELEKILDKVILEESLNSSEPKKDHILKI